MKPGPKPGSVRLRGMERVAGKYTVLPSGCWQWTRYRNAWGYGVTGAPGGRTMLAHRYVWQHFHGEVEPTMLVCHHCDNPACINPDHLFVGTASDNNKDMWNKGRGVVPTGEAHGSAKLTAVNVRFIRAQFGKVSDCELGRRYGVTSATIRQIRIGITWRHV